MLDMSAIEECSGPAKAGGAREKVDLLQDAARILQFISQHKRPPVDNEVCACLPGLQSLEGRDGGAKAMAASVASRLSKHKDTMKKLYGSDSAPYGYQVAGGRLVVRPTRGPLWDAVIAVAEGGSPSEHQKRAGAKVIVRKKEGNE